MSEKDAIIETKVNGPCACGVEKIEGRPACGNLACFTAFTSPILEVETKTIEAERSALTLDAGSTKKPTK